MKYIFLIGRILFSLIFIVKPLEHFSERMINHGAAMGLPMANVFVPFWGIVAILGGLSILLGFKAKIGAWLIVIFLIPTIIYMHPFWSAEGQFAQMMQGFCFWKNVSLLGAALMIAYTGSGPFSLSKNLKN